jgi:hypothetical protein
MKLRLNESTAARLNGFLQSRADEAVRSDHWKRLGALNRVSVSGGTVWLRGGAGFDGDYELHFRRPTWRHRLSRHLRFDPVAFALRRLLSSDTISDGLARHYRSRLGSIAVRDYLEIGAGGGSLAVLLHREFGCNVTIVDLPEVLPMSFLRLQHEFPDTSFCLPHEDRDATLRFLTPDQVGRVASGSIDLAVNTSSFQEMLAPEIAKYFALMRRALTPSGLFFCSNREEKILDGRPNRFEDYPWGEHTVIFDRRCEIHLSAGIAPVRQRLCRLT